MSRCAHHVLYLQTRVPPCTDLPCTPACAQAHTQHLHADRHARVCMQMCPVDACTCMQTACVPPYRSAEHKRLDTGTTRVYLCATYVSTSRPSHRSACAQRCLQLPGQGAPRPHFPQEQARTVSHKSHSRG